MKSMLYVGATLMIGASIYGFVDYKQTHDKKEFREMYAEKKPAAEPGVTNVAEKTEVKVTNTETAVKKRVKTKKKTTGQKEELIEVKPIPAEEKRVTGNIADLTNTERPEPARESTIVKKAKKKRKISTKIFSRAPLREEEELIEIAPKKEEKKTATKEL